DLGTLVPGQWESAALDINDSGQVVGYSETGEMDPTGTYNIVHAFLYQNGNMIDLGALGDLDSMALAINSSGEVVGLSVMEVVGGEHFRAFLWKNGVMNDLGALKKDGGSAAFDINDAGQIVGWTQVDPMSA